MPDLPQRTVIVIGAGISGLAAAVRLKTAGVDVVVLEARDRVGGRILTDDSWGVPIDLGGSWVHGTDNNPLLVSRDPPLYTGRLFTDQSYAYYRPKTFIPTSLFEMTRYYLNFTAIESRLSARQSSHDDSSLDVSAEEFYRTESAAVGNRMRRWWRGESAARDMEDVLMNLFHATISASGGDPEAVSVSADWNSFYQKRTLDAIAADGMGTVIQNLMRYGDLAVGRNILLEKAVTRIQYGDALAGSSNPSSPPKVRITCTDGTVFESRHVVVTVPIGVLKAHHKTLFDPVLPPKVVGAIDGLGAGLLDKVVLRFERKWWKSTTAFSSFFLDELPTSTPPIPGSFKKYPHYPFYIVDISKVSDAPVLAVLCYRLWAEAAEVAHPESVVNMIFDALKKTIGRGVEDVPRPFDYKITKWFTDPYSLCSYSYLPTGLGSFSTAQDRTFRTFQTPVAGVVGFAGEHTSEMDWSSIHGAWMSGDREGRRIVAALVGEGSKVGDRRLMDGEKL
ncbi:amine oxidase [Gonapodya prolifera JEL478]|uniref:Amine oxidase n=1 Tax=Gonapodya prolifera (strain JEL478) TaxID=1344416 RepID=A0A139A1G5_GONPJ|nr:amine oxidase [Gonapodya prolifera JEL478]|eukprot:KXS10203.1 amine oxidase [Gonapodya prolifera JEL478]